MHDRDFPKAFAALTGTPPFPWQEALYVEFIAARVPRSAGIPTGLGKTSVIAVWLCALATQPSTTPRRLAYVVNRRTVVDQTTREVETWRSNLEAAGLRSKLASLCAVPLAKDDDSPLAISTLRGQFADNRAWSADPARPAVIVGTVDMIGSRLLFNGYGTGFKTRPHHAGFLGQDTLVAHDEAHLEPAFQQLIETIAERQTLDRDPRPLRVLALSATNRRDGETSFGLTQADHENAIIRQRIHAAKKPVLYAIADEKKELAEKLAKLALARRDSGRAIVVFARNLETVQRVAAALEKGKVPAAPVKLIGPLRGFERDNLVRRPVFQRFLPPTSRVQITEPLPTGTVYLIATSAGEVGVNLSADDLICDLSTFESMAQRLGRVNRFGLLADSVIDIVVPESFDEKDPITPHRQKTLELFRQLETQGKASPSALGEIIANLSDSDRIAAFSPEPAILPATDILFDTWSLTSIRGSLPGRPPVADYLHGVAEWEPPETLVAWRKEVAWITERLSETHPPAELLTDYPLLPHELLRERSDRVHEQLRRLACSPEIAALPAWLIAEDGDVEIVTLSALAELDTKGAVARLRNHTLLLPPSAGGLNPDGTLDADAPASGAGIEDIADIPPGHDTPPRRCRIRFDDSLADLDAPDGFRLIRPRIDLDPEAEESDEAATGDDDNTSAALGRYWYWLESPQQIGGANLHQAPVSVFLAIHNADVERLATAIVDKLALPPELRRPVILAARHHDSGKNRHAWQKSIGNPTPDVPLAKAGRYLGPRAAGEHYRHEFGSLIDLASDPAFHALTDDEKDVALHLVAAHHGRARPHFPAEEADDPAAALATVKDVSAATPLRFARLQRRFGRWGLAYLESILRAADYAASANPSATVEDTK